MLEAGHPDNSAKVHAAFYPGPWLAALQSSLYTSWASGYWPHLSKIL